MNVALLLTGTVKPEKIVSTKLLDPNIRQQQYLDSISFWLTTHFPIVFVENSNVDLSSHFEQAISTNRLEILTFKDCDNSKELGKGFGEINCMAYAHAHSRLLKNADFIFKITGRLKILNYKSFYKYAFMMDSDIAADLAHDFGFADSRFWGYKPSFFMKHLSSFKNIINDSQGIYFEHILAKSIIKAINEGESFAAFDTRLRINGMSGTSHKSYNSSYLMWFIRNLIKKIRYKLLIKSLSKEWPQFKSYPRRYG